MTTSAVPRYDSLAGSVLAVLPALYGVSLVLPAVGYDWNPIEYGIVAIAFYLASVAFAAIDEHRLRQTGLRAATAYWALLGVMPYLVARARVLIDENRPGLALLWLAITATSVSALALLLLAAI